MRSRSTAPAGARCQRQRHLEGDDVLALAPSTLVAVEVSPAPPLVEQGGAPPPPPQRLAADRASGRVVRRVPLPGFAAGDDIVPVGGRLVAWIHDVDLDRVVERIAVGARRRTSVTVRRCP